jgi:hypothetical protein
MNFVGDEIKKYEGVTKVLSGRLVKAPETGE